MTSHPSVLTQSLNVNAPVFVRWEVASPTAFTCNKKKRKIEDNKALNLCDQQWKKEQEN